MCWRCVSSWSIRIETKTSNVIYFEFSLRFHLPVVGVTSPHPIQPSKSTTQNEQRTFGYLPLMVQKSGEPVEVGSLSHYLQGFIHPRWCRIFSINCSNQSWAVISYTLTYCNPSSEDFQMFIVSFSFGSHAFHGNPIGSWKLPHPPEISKSGFLKHTLHFV